MATLIILGGITISNSEARDLKPSDIRSLEKSQAYIESAKELIEKENPPYSKQSARQRSREFKKAASYLKKSERTFKKYKGESMADDGMNDVSALKRSLKQKQEAFKNSKIQQANIAESNHVDLVKRLGSQKTKDDVVLMKELKGMFMTAWHSSPEDPSQEKWDANQHTEIWAEEEIAELVYAIQNADTLFRDVDNLEAQYKDIAKTREGLKAIGTNLTDLINFSKHFKASLPIIKAVIPNAIKTTAGEYKNSYKKELDNFNAADKERDKSRLLIMGNPYRWYESLRLRMKAQIMVYKATDLPALSEMKKIQKEAKDYAEDVSKKLVAWQKKQKGDDAEELKRQEIKQEEMVRKNQLRMEKNKKELEERLRLRDEERKARHLRLMDIRKTTK